MPPRPLSAATLTLCAVLCACTGGGEQADRPTIALASATPGTFSSSRPGTPIPLETIKTMSDQQVLSTFGRPVFERAEGPSAKLVRFRSDACDLDVFLYASGGGWQARHAEARDPALRSLPVDRCAGSVAAQRR
ncbi:MAG: hypothetical protein IPK81_13475 [Rhodospirillales bacterium]|nr:MAG: hypothetical protein IPK81_13475 [Rhodospirillales bacterium]